MVIAAIDLKSILDDGITHVATSYQLSKNPIGFNKQEEEGTLYLDLRMSTEFLKEYVIDTSDLEPDEVLYGRTKVHYSDGTSSKWTTPAATTANMDGFSSSGTIVITPEVLIEEGTSDVTLGGFDVFTSEFQMYAGDGEHESTTWRIVDLHGQVVWERKRDVDNLLSIEVPRGYLNNNRAYTLEAVHHSDTNSSSEPGRLHITTGLLSTNLRKARKM